MHVRIAAGFHQSSSGFTLPRHRSPSFGYQLLRSHSVLDAPFTTPDGWARAPAFFFLWTGSGLIHFHFAAIEFRLCSVRVALRQQDAPKNSATCVRVRLLGPCFKTGREASLSTRPSFEYDKTRRVAQKWNITGRIRHTGTTRETRPPMNGDGASNGTRPVATSDQIRTPTHAREAHILHRAVEC